ncbi:MAG: hypothetical protein ACRDDD_01085, partial [Plesiomonas sp.]
SGHYPTIDIEQSISRAMPQIVSAEHLRQAQMVKQRYSRYRQVQDLLALGGYQPGKDPQLDTAIASYPAICAYLQQGMQEKVTLSDSTEQLLQLR